MAVIEVVKGGQKIENVVITTPQPMTPTGAVPPDIGYVEIGTSEDRGSIWMTGQGPPTEDAGQAGDMYLDMDTGDVWQWNGTEWELQGTFAPSTDTPEEILAKIITVDGEGSGLDADTLDGHDSTYFATASGLALAEGDIDVLQNEVDAVAAENDQQNIDISMKANIASPLFTGDPRAPTPPTADNDTSIATTAYVKANIATIPPNDWASIPGKPATFPPTVPIAQADVTNLVSDLALKAPLASPTFTGDPKAPTPATSDNDTSIATTAFVKAVTGAIVGGALISDTPPASPAVGQMWFESDSGNTFIWYADADSSQWVQVNIQPAIATNPNAGMTAQTRNRIVNGGFQISQELADAGVATHAAYACDGWLLGTAGMTSPLCNRVSTSNTPDGSRYHLATGAAAKASLAAGDLLFCRTPIEGLKVTDFRYGYPSARQAVLRFSCYMPVAGTYCISVRNAASDRSGIFEYVIAADEVGKWVTKTVVLTPDTIGAWYNDTNVGFNIGWTFAAGSTFRGVAGWQAGTFHATANQVNMVAAGATSAAIADVGLYMDPLNTGLPAPWVAPDEAQELTACQRYWQPLVMDMYGYALGAAYVAQTIMFPVKPRTTPALTTNPDGVGSNATGASFDSAGPHHCRAILTAAATGGTAIANRTGKANARM